MVPQKRRENTLTSSQTHVLIWGFYEQTNNSRKLQSGSFPIKMCITTLEIFFRGIGDGQIGSICSVNVE